MHWQSPATNISFPEWSMKEWMAKPPPQSCHIHQHFEQTLDLTFTCYMSVSFAQHGRTFLLQEEYTWPSPQKLGTVWISHPSNTRTKKKQNKKNPQKPPTTQLKSLLPKKSRTQGQQQTLPAFYTLHTFAEERLPTGAEKFVNGKKNHLTLMDSLKC